MKIFNRLGYVLALLAIAALGVTGCNQTPESTPAQLQSASQQQDQDRIKVIQNDPNLTPEAKQRALAALQSQQAALMKKPTSP